MTTPRYLVLGSNSFSGASFIRWLVDQGRDVLAASRSLQAHRALLPYAWSDRAEAVRFFQIDINHDLERLETLLRSEKPTHVVNFAAQSMVGESWEHPDHWMMTNVVSTVRLHDVLRRHASLEKYIHVTTPEVYGSTDGWVAEGAPFNPSTPYAVSRAAGDMSLRTYVSRYGFPAVSTRAANVYGPGQQLYRIIPRTVLAAMGGQKLKLDGGGASLRVFIHMDDVSDATCRIAERGEIGKDYHISGTELISIRSLVELILARLGKSFEDCVELGPERPGKDTTYQLASDRLRKTLGWRDTVSLENGIDGVIAWAHQFRDVLDQLPSRYEHKA